MSEAKNIKGGFARGRWTVVAAVTAVLTGCASPQERAQQHYDRGMALIAKHDDLGARLELLNAVKYKSDKIEVWRALAGVDERTKAPKALFNDLRRIVELDPNDLPARLKLARMMAYGGAADAALRVIDTNKENEKLGAEFHAVRSIILLRMNDGGAAVREAQQAFDLDPKNSDAITILASKKTADGDFDGALKLLASISDDSEDATRATLQRIDIYVRKKDLAKAEELLRTLIAKSPQDVSYQDKLIQLLVAQKKFPEAEKELRARIEANPSNTRLGLEFVRFLTATKGAAAGMAELEARIKSGGDVFDYKLAMAELDLAQNRSDDAISVLQKLATEGDKPERIAAAKLKLAQIYIAKGNTTAADSLISDVLSKDRKNVGALRLRAVRRIDTGQLDSAIADLREAINEQPKSVDLLILLATAYERGGKSELADRQYADAIKLSNSNVNVVLGYVAFLQRKGDAARAEEVLTEAAGRNPSNIQILSSLGQIRLSRQNWAGAMAIADAISRLNGGRAVADQIKASALAGQDKVDESIAALEDAHKAAPNAVQPALALASAYVKQGKPEKATDLLKELSAKDPNSAQLLVYLGEAQLAQKKDQDALETFKKAVAQQPKDPAGYTALSEFYVRNKNYDEAGNVLQTALSKLPGNINLRLSSAGLKILKGDNDAAISDYEGILKDQPNALIAVNNLTSLLLDHRSDKQSLEQAAALSEKLKNSPLPQFQDTLGWADYKRGDFKSAIATLEGVVEKAPNLAAAHYHLGMSYQAAGQGEKAAEQFKAALSLEPDGTPLKENIKAALK